MTTDVLITVDTEFWPRREYVEAGDYRADFERDVLGRTSAGDFGLRYQLELMNAHQVRAVFFVEALSAYALGNEPVREMVDLVQGAGHEVQLHLHSEWLPYMSESPLPGRVGQHLRNFSFEDQSRLIELGLAKLRECGARDVCAFRAGNFGANLDTLRALSRHAVPFDTSYNYCLLGAACDIQTSSELNQAVELNGVCELPVTCFRDFLGRPRPLQLTACSTREMERVLLDAAAAKLPFVVIVSHSFELIRRRAQASRPDPVVIRRFEQLCRFLRDHRDILRAATFSDLDRNRITAATAFPGLRTRPLDTLKRIQEQAVRRLISLTS